MDLSPCYGDETFMLCHAFLRWLIPTKHGFASWVSVLLTVSWKYFLVETILLISSAGVNCPWYHFFQTPSFAVVTMLWSFSGMMVVKSCLVTPDLWELTNLLRYSITPVLWEMSHFSSVFLSRQGTTQTCRSLRWYRNYVAEQQMQSTPWSPGQPDLLARLQHTLLGELRAEPHLGWFISHHPWPGRGGEDEKQALPCDPADAQRWLYCGHEPQTDGEYTLCYCLQKSCLETVWQSPGSYRQVSSLKHL